MPGVPSGRGCDACRKQKKKCDQAKPACSRCTRLGVQCIGAGQQRYKFLNADSSGNPPDSQPPRLDRKASSNSSSNTSLLADVTRTPSNEGALLADALVHKLQAWDDLRYHLTWTYGIFLEEIPRRLGSNAALDTAVNALVCAHSQLNLSSGIASVADPEALTKYNHAVRTLRLCLDDPVKAREASTLCAVYLLMICQGFLGHGSGLTTGSHGEGAAVILKTRGITTSSDDFERKILLTIRGPVLFESLFSARIHFTPQEWQRLVVNDMDGDTAGGKLMRSLAFVPDFMERGQAAITMGIGLEELLLETTAQYNMLKVVSAELISKFDPSRLPGPEKDRDVRYHAQYQRLYGLCLSSALIYNCILKALAMHIITTNPTWSFEILPSPVPDLMDLHNDASAYIATIMQLAEEARPFRPLASSCFTLFLMLAWVSASDEMTRQIVYARFIDYTTDFPHHNDKDWLEELEEVERRLFLMQVRTATTAASSFVSQHIEQQELPSQAI